MASKRKLKREVVNLVSELYDEAFLLYALSTGEAQAKLDELMDDILVFADDTIRRVQHPDGKDDPKLVKAYYRKLREDIARGEEAFNERLTSFIEQA
ncbi:MAG: hypothetical protein SPK09_00960 [Porphyromonas sp.]|nr:hypothetical protein [Porphyromonas sp.]